MHQMLCQICLLISVNIVAEWWTCLAHAAGLTATVYYSGGQIWSGLDDHLSDLGCSYTSQIHSPLICVLSLCDMRTGGHVIECSFRS